MRDLQAARGTPLTPRRRTGVLAATAAVALAADVVTKVLAVEHLSDRAVDVVAGTLVLRVSRNPGAAFGIAQGATVLFSLVAVTVVVVIARTARRLTSTRWAIALGLVLGGALGNLVDRLFRDPGPLRGKVVDFIDLDFWPSFNLADTAIVVGGALAVLLSARGVEPGPDDDAGDTEA